MIKCLLPELSPQRIQISKMMQRLSHKRVVWVEHRLSDFQGSLQQWSSLEIIQWHIKNSILLLLLHDRSSECHAMISWSSVTQRRRVRHGLHILKIQYWFCNFIIWNLRLSSSYITILILFQLYLTYLVFVFKIQEKKYHFNDIFYSNQIFWSKSLKMTENRAS